MATTTGTLLTYVETSTQAGTGTLNNTTTGIPMLNDAMLDFRSELIKRGVDAAQTQESYANGASTTSGGFTYSTFSWPSDMFRLKVLEVNMTDTNPQNYILAMPVDVANLPENTAFDYLRANQPTSEPVFDNRGDTYEIFPSFAYAPNTTNAIHIIYYLTPTTYSTTSDTLNYPDSLDWYILAIKVKAIYYQSLGKFDEADYWEKQYQARLNKLHDSIAPGSQQPIQAQGLPLTGFEY